MMAVENILAGYDSRAQAEDWVKWSKDNHGLSDLLAQAMKAASIGE